jgi:hypothetical protein
LMKCRSSSSSSSTSTSILSLLMQFCTSFSCIFFTFSLPFAYLVHFYLESKVCIEWGRRLTVYLFAYLSVWLTICLSDCLFVCLIDYLSMQFWPGDTLTTNSSQ